MGIILTLFFFSLSSFAQWKFSGNAGPYVNALNLPSTPVSPTIKSGVVTELKLDRKAEAFRFRSEFALRTDFLARDSIETVQFMPKNIYLQKKLSSLMVKAGYQILSLDGPDVVNPADVVNARNWIDPTNPIVMGSPGLSLSQEIEKWNWEVFYVPYQTRPILPGAHSPWLPRRKRLPLESNNLELQIPDNVRYHYSPGKEIHNALSNNFTGKVQRKSENLELQLLYHNGLNQTPFLLTDVNGTLISASPKRTILVDSPVKLIPLYYRQQAVAGTFVIPLKSWAIKGGMNWVKPYADYRVPGETKTSVVGVEKNTETSLGMVTAIVQYIHQEQLAANQISFLRSFFRNAWSGGLRVPFGEETSLLMGGIYDTIGHSSIYRANLTHRLSDKWSVEGGAQYLEGPSKTLVGIYSRYDSYQFRTLYYW